MFQNLLEPSNHNDFGEILVTYRKQQKITQERLAEKLDVSTRA